MPSKKTTEQFIVDAIKIHGDRYDYSKVKYINSAIKVCIICPEHGEFWQMPKVHLQGCGCSKCGITFQHNQQRLTTEEFIEKARKIHGDKYDYSKTEYINNRNKICVVCPKHGEFYQTGGNHLKGHGCPKCGDESGCKQRKLSLDIFIEKAVNIHGDRYDYSKVEYKNAYTPIIIKCPIHGEFTIRPNNHLRGQGCPLCGNKQKGKYHKLTTQDFIKRAKDVHGDKYDYSKVEYVNYLTPLTIICFNHGDFQQLPSAHLKGHGCPKCGRSFNQAEMFVTTQIQKHFNNVITQYRPKWLGNITSRQSIDIYLSDYNIGIEYHGRQHFMPIKIFGGDDGHLKTLERDERKYEKCLEQGIKLFYISFEKEIPETYFAPIYTNIDDLIKVIKEEIKNGIQL